jgi:NAD(P)H-hydrate epimerase
VIIQSSLPEALLSVYNKDEFDENIAKEAIRWADIVAIGPGIGTDETAVKLLTAVLKNSVRPIVIDADGLNILAKDPKLWELVPKGSVITPHPGEMSRLCECTVNEILSDTAGICQGFAKARGVVCVLKDHSTAVSDGNDLYINSTGNSGMATAGSGDVLTGMIAALIAQGLSPFAAAMVGVRAHGMAGDLAAEALGEYSLMASDIIDCIPKVLK